MKHSATTRQPVTTKCNEVIHKQSMNEPQRQLIRTSISRLINECKTTNELKQIHTHIIKSPLLHESHRQFLTNRLLFQCAFSHFRSLPYALNLFQFMQNPNLFSYNVIIRAFSCILYDFSGFKCLPILNFYKGMLNDGIRPDNLCFPFLIKDCASRVDLMMGMSVYAHIVKFGFDFDVYILNNLINLFCECGVLGCAKKVFDKMPERDVVSWNSIIGGCLRNGEIDFGLDLFWKMEERKSIYTWNSIISGFIQNGRPKEALEFFREMLIDDEVKPDKMTVATVLSACSSLGAIHIGEWVHGYLKRSELGFDMVICTALIDMYGKCGCVEKAVEVFREMREKDVMAWTAMISVFAFHGHAEEALRLLKEMGLQGVKPNHVTFVGVLSACAHSGLVEEGRFCFELMRRVYAIEPHTYHYSCMVDILSRAGLFGEAKTLIRSMPMEPDVYVWGALLGGCQMHGNLELGEKVALRLIDLEPENHAFYINLCEIYAKSGKFEDVKRTRILMQQKGIKKQVPGCSVIEIDGKVYEFSVRGALEVPIEEIVEVLNGLIGSCQVTDYFN